MTTEITNTTDVSKRGWVLYDGQCGFCVELAERWRGTLEARGFGLAPLQAEWAARKLGLRAGEPLTEMRVIAPDGAVLGGADGVVALARKIWWAWPLYVLAHAPGARGILRRGYRRISEQRHCAAGQCEVRSDSFNRNSKIENRK